MLRRLLRHGMCTTHCMTLRNAHVGSLQVVLWSVGWDDDDTVMTLFVVESVLLCFVTVGFGAFSVVVSRVHV